jgi:hypothetical protein
VGRLALAVLLIYLPIVAQADVLATFDWVPGTATPENPLAAATTTASGSLTLDLSSFSLTGTSSPPNFGQYYASGNPASSANVVGLSYTFADGVTVDLPELTSVANLNTSTSWVTSGGDTPYNVPTGTTAGDYLVSAFTLYGTADGANFAIANSAGTAGATYANGVGNADNSYNGSAGHAAITDGGYWELVQVTPVPLQPAGVMLLSGICLLGWALRSRVSLGAV